jgi:hypothetical protein
VLAKGFAWLKVYKRHMAKQFDGCISLVQVGHGGWCDGWPTAIVGRFGDDRVIPKCSSAKLVVVFQKGEKLDLIKGHVRKRWKRTLIYHGGAGVRLIIYTDG